MAACDWNSKVRNYHCRSRTTSSHSRDIAILAKLCGGLATQPPSLSLEILGWVEIRAPKSFNGCELRSVFHQSKLPQPEPASQSAMRVTNTGWPL
jgi:hypothetical protein